MISRRTALQSETAAAMCTTAIAVTGTVATRVAVEDPAIEASAKAFWAADARHSELPHPYTDEEFQYILKLGVWLRTQIERDTRIGREAAARFVTYEASRLRRRRTP